MQQLPSAARRRATRTAILGLLVLLATVLLVPARALALRSSNSTSYTVTTNTGGQLQIVQDAYMPVGSYTDLNLRGASDIYILDGYLYIADTGNSRAIRLNLADGERDIFGEGLLRSPQGIAADPEGRVYVADSGTNEAYRFNADLELEQVFMKPDTPKFGLTAQFKPLKVAPANDGGVYLVNEGSVAGLVHMDRQGVFLGYFGSSPVAMSPLDVLMDMILTDEQMSRFLSRTPPSFSNIIKGPDGLIYSVNRGSSVTVNRHSIGGENILTNPQMPVLIDAIDLTITPEGRIYTVDLEGYITEITSDGYLVNMFAGGSDTERAGLFTRPTGIASDADSRIFVLDQEKNNIQVFEPTHSQRQLHQAIHAYEQGSYTESRTLLSNVLRVNNTSRLAHTYMGKNYLQAGNYPDAAYHFRISDQRADYSAAFWEIRNTWIQNNLLVILVVVIVLALLLVWRKSEKKKRQRARNEGTYTPSAWERLKQRNRLIFDLTQLRHALFHPTDNAYEISVKRTGTYLSATLIFVVVFVLLVLLQVGSGFVFSTNLRDYQLIPVLLFYVSAIVLFVLVNYLIVAIRDGKGTLRSIYVSTAYSLAPIIFFWPIAIAVGNVITLDEAFFYQLLIVVGIVWSLVNLVTHLIQIHEYSFSSTISSVLLTLFGMFVIVVVISLLWLIFRQMFYQIQEMHLEVTLR